MLTENICCNCHWYEGVKAVPGTAPCSKQNKQVLWNEDCDDIWLIPNRLKVEKLKEENKMTNYGEVKKFLYEVPTDIAGRIKEEFFGWPKGTNVSDIEKWFDKKTRGEDTRK